MERFSLSDAQAYSKEGRIPEWVHSYLRGPGDNRALSEGLGKAERHWLGPVHIPVPWLERCCGPEAHMEYREDADAWARSVSVFAECLASGDDIPPVIAEYRGGRLSVRDGNHRLGAFDMAGLPRVWALIWYNSLPDLEEHRAVMVAARVL
jgi:hypothetical protein